MTQVLKSYIAGTWSSGSGTGRALYNPATGAKLAEASSDGVDFAAGLAYARERGGPALRELTFAQRGELLLAVSKAIHEHRDELLELETANGGNTRGDGKFDLDGGTGTLAYYAKLAQSLGDKRYLVDGEPERLSRSPRWVGQHIYSSRRGVAILINAFNFPIWGLCEKAALAWLAGVPVFAKPATSTALVAHRVAEILVDAKILPDGAFSFLAGSAGDLLDHVQAQDVISFTGSSDTAATIRGHKAVIANNVPVNVEADSLNAAVLGPDVESDSNVYDLFLAEVSRDITQKAGQKCTAIRRVLIPASRCDDVIEDLKAELGNIKLGDPSLGREVKMGPVATSQQYDDVRAGISELRKVASVVMGDGGRGEPAGVEGQAGYFVAPVLLKTESAPAGSPIHNKEVFGPVATVIAYDGSAAQACAIVSRSGGGLVSSVYTGDKDFAAEMIEGIAPYHGRLHIATPKITEHSLGPGTVLPQLLHGGPGRAGGGEELGGLRGLRLYMQRTAVQGDQPLLDKIFS